MKLGTWQCERRRDMPGALPCTEEMRLAFDKGRRERILVCPALFDEANKLRRFTLGVMRELDALGIDSALFDLPGMNESLAPLDQQTVSQWREDAKSAAREFAATHVLSIRAGANYLPYGLPGWRYAPLSASRQLAAMLRAQVISARESGQSLARENLLADARENGAMLGGWRLGAQMIREMETAQIEPRDDIHLIDQDALEGPGLWLRAEPGEDRAQSAQLAGIIASSLNQGRQAQA